MLVAIDTNVLAYAEGAGDETRRALAMALMARLPRERGGPSGAGAGRAVPRCWSASCASLQPRHSEAVLQWSDAFAVRDSTWSALQSAFDLSAAARAVDLGQPDPFGGRRAALPPAAQRRPAGRIHVARNDGGRSLQAVRRMRCSPRSTRTQCVDYAWRHEHARPFLPFALPDIGDEEIAEVVDTLKSGWVTTGPKAAALRSRFQRLPGRAGPALPSPSTRPPPGCTWRWRRWASARATRSSPPPTPSPPPPRWCATWVPTCGWWTSIRPR